MKCPACGQELEEDSKESPSAAWMQRVEHYRKCGVIVDHVHPTEGWSCPCGEQIWLIWDIEEHFKTHKDWKKMLTLAAMGDM